MASLSPNRAGGWHEPAGRAAMTAAMRGDAPPHNEPDSDEPAPASADLPAKVAHHDGVLADHGLALDAHAGLLGEHHSDIARLKAHTGLGDSGDGHQDDGG